jgi:hypothetical protein
MKQNEALHPVDAGLLGANGIMLLAYHPPHLVELFHDDMVLYGFVFNMKRFFA